MSALVSDGLLAAENIDTFYGPSHILRNVTLRIRRGEAVSLLGRNGVGKTTALRTLAGLVRAKNGRIAFAGREIGGLRASAISRAGLALVPEGRGIFRNLTVAENLQLACRPATTGPSRSLDDIFAMFPRLAERRRNWGDQLSGGEQQMLTIGRALLTNPSLLMIDEATEGLAPKVRDDIWRTLRIVREQGVAILVVDKNIDDLLALCDRHVILVKGEIVFEGSSAALRDNPDVIHTHLGI